MKLEVLMNFSTILSAESSPFPNSSIKVSNLLWSQISLLSSKHLYLSYQTNFFGNKNDLSVIVFFCNKLWAVYDQI